ncbi:Nucleoside-diphosphate-sugar epimerase [Mesonia phycicola]|uniref:Nucleoside-diphosphate-sugar epimerase n=1 Tax=Mesonia phycicola TaxID=579105 RepID=A0A1M6GXY3_9FLAO|nr:NAD-dependent epimerase/dehydratase family protein [Mesonia phycicola]SHJ14792.1 Nucleoside-diphosphate-sugar epimerase [Mesonia phycicola]
MILVTGATGLVGSHLLAELLLREEKVRALYRTHEKIKAAEYIIQQKIGENSIKLLENIEWFLADITNIPQLTDAFVDIEYVYHCAGLISYNPKHYKLLRKINIEGTANVVNLALSKRVKKLCHVSSIAALGSELNHQPITEKSPRNNDAEHDNYSITKYGAEMEVWRASQEGLNVVVVNPGVIIGAGNWSSGSGQLFSKVHNGLSYYPPLTTGFVAVEDVAKSMVLLMQSNIENEGFVLVAENLSFKIVLAEIAKALKKPEPRKKLQPWMVFIGWLFQYIGRKLFNTEQIITKKSIKGAFGKSYYSNKKIVKLLDFEFTPIQQSIKETSRYFIKTKV